MKYKRLIMIKIILVLILLLSVTVVFAKSTITSTNKSDVTHGQNINVHGIDFGFKNVAQPIRYETFENENMQIGQSLDEVPAGEKWWSSRTPLETTFDNKAAIPAGSVVATRHQFSKKHIRWHSVDPTNKGMGNSGWFYRENIGFKNTKKAYVNLWVYVDIVSCDQSGKYPSSAWQQKFFTLGASEVHSSMPFFSANFFVNEDGVRLWRPSVSKHEPLYVPETHYPQEGFWVNVVLMYKDSDINVENGESYFSCSTTPLGALPYHKFSHKQAWPYPDYIITRTDENQDFVDSLQLGYLTVNGLLESNTYWDDVYIDNSWARVEIGDQQIYDECTHREMQIPTSWSNNSIEISINQGAFQDGGMVYLFVVDEDGTPSEGYPIKINNSIENPSNFDVNEDGTVNVQDVVICINTILGITAGEADVNSDGNTNTQDVIAIVNEILDN